ncbi:MAG: 2-oxoglutarate oxidoreductase [Planctomycetes bacterium]|nr:2-oxoglutarate oxidoreductase [Planctomycetota bacterium]
MANPTQTTREPIYRRPDCMLDVPTHYCSGCGHGTTHRLVAEIIDELGIREKTIGIAPVGCAVIAYDYINIDWSEAAHGRPPAVATGLKRVQPDRIVFTYQGDGDLASIGMAETVHAANRGENITIVFINNTIYAMTQGQMAPTTVVGQETTTTPRGRDVENEGPPIKMCELLAGFERVKFLARGTVVSPKHVRQTKKWLKKGFEYQLNNVGFSLIEVLSPCPTYWRMSPPESAAYVEETLVQTFPLGVVKDTGPESRQ